MYVGTFLADSGLTLIRIDVQTRASRHGLTSIASYTMTEGDGAQSQRQTTLGPDVCAVGVPIMSVIELLRDVHFCGQGSVELVHASDVFGEPEMELVQECSGIAHAAVALTTTATLQ